MTPRRKAVVGAGDHVDYDTARPRHLTPAEQAYRDRQRAAARRNLAAACCDRWGIDVATAKPRDLAVHGAAREFGELAAMLGLDASERKPGACKRCGSPIPLSMATKHHGKAHGLCRTCRKEQA